MFDALKAIDFLVMPSYWEGFGYAAVEAMAAGKAVVGTWCSSLAELIAEGKTGILVAPRSAEQLADAMVVLTHDAALCSSFGSAGLDRARRMFSLQQMVNATEHVFLTVVDRYRRLHGGNADVAAVAPAGGMHALRGS